MARWIAAIFAIVFLSGSDCEHRRLLELDEGLFAQPEYLPWAVVAEPELVVEAGNAVDWWNAEMSRDGVIRVVHHFEGETEYPEATHGVVNVFYGYLPSDDLETDTGGLFEYALRDGQLLYGTVTVSSDLGYHDQTISAIIRHELGHALGLADDPASIDLNSVMSYELAEHGELTEQDFDLVAEIYDNQNTE